MSDPGAGCTLEVGSKGRTVVLTLALDRGLHVPFELTPDEARDLSNSLGAAIKAASTAGVMTS